MVDSYTEELRADIRLNESLVRSALKELPIEVKEAVRPYLDAQTPLEDVLHMTNGNVPNGCQVEIIDFTKGPARHPLASLSRNKVLLSLRIGPRNENRLVSTHLYTLGRDGNLQYDSELALNSWSSHRTISSSESPRSRISFQEYVPPEPPVLLDRSIPAG